jgi:cell volume regulation protein A
VTADDVVLTLTIMLAAGLVARFAAGVVHLPAILLTLGAGVALGPSALDLVDVPLDSIAAQVGLTLGVSFILFHGGMGLSLRVLERVAVGLLLLAIPGVFLTACIVGVVAALAFDLPVTAGLLVGAALAPTDPAILVPLFERMRVRVKLSQTAIAESAINDPTGAVLALTFAAIVESGRTSVLDALADFVVNVLVSTAIGIGFGVVLALVVSDRRGGVWRESSAIAVIAVVAGSLVSADFAGGSGLLGAFLAGLIVGNMGLLGLGMHSAHEAPMRATVAAAAEVASILVFVLLGVNLPLRAMADDLVPALLVVGTLIAIARPITVLACLFPDRRGRWTREEIVFLAWTRETGVVPAALAGILVAEGVAHADVVVTCVAVAVVTTLAVQATTKAPLAARLGLLAGESGAAPP